MEKIAKTGSVQVLRLEGHYNHTVGLQESCQSRSEDLCLHCVTSISINVPRDGWLAVTLIGIVGNECRMHIAIFACQAASANSLSEDINQWILENQIDPNTIKTANTETQGMSYLVLVGEKQGRP